MRDLQADMETSISNISRTAIHGNAPLVSIVIPAYNYAQFISETIDSALAVTGVECEILIIDDGSTDGTAAVVAAYKDKVRYLYQNNQGLSAARNTGIRESRGEFLVFLDADDLLRPEMVERSLEALKAVGESFALISHFPDLIDIKGNPISPETNLRHPDTEITMLDLLIMNRFPTFVFVRKGVFEEVGYFDTQLKASEDRDMWIRIARRPGNRIVFGQKARSKYVIERAPAGRMYPSGSR
jgi:glycosyltransferase involved in cell wall biosynthesis